MDEHYINHLEKENKELKGENFLLAFQLMELSKEFKIFREKQSDAEHDADYRVWRKKADDEINEKLRKLGM